MIKIGLQEKTRLMKERTHMSFLTFPKELRVGWSVIDLKEITNMSKLIQKKSKTIIFVIDGGITLKKKQNSFFLFTYNKYFSLQSRGFLFIFQLKVGLTKHVSLQWDYNVVICTCSITLFFLICNSYLRIDPH